MNPYSVFLEFNKSLIMIFLLHFLFSTQSSLLMLMPFQIEGVLIFCAHIFLFFYSIMPHSQIILNESLKRRKDNGTFSLSLSFSVCACTCVRVCACEGGLDVCVCVHLRQSVEFVILFLLIILFKQINNQVANRTDLSSIR